MNYLLIALSLISIIPSMFLATVILCEAESDKPKWKLVTFAGVFFALLLAFQIKVWFFR